MARDRRSAKGRSGCHWRLVRQCEVGHGQKAARGTPVIPSEANASANYSQQSAPHKRGPGELNHHRNRREGMNIKRLSAARAPPGLLRQANGESVEGNTY